MTRFLDADLEEKQRKRRESIGLALEIGLEAAVSRAGGVLQGFSVRLRPEDCLLIMRVDMPGGPMVCFSGGSDAAGCILKANRDASRDNLRFVPDRYSNGDSGQNE